jgi:hypothetical protein
MYLVVYDEENKVQTWEIVPADFTVPDRETWAALVAGEYAALTVHTQVSHLVCMIQIHHPTWDYVLVSEMPGETNLDLLRVESGAVVVHELTSEEIEAAFWAWVRPKRDKALDASDWPYTSDPSVKLNGQKKQDGKASRQDLRDLPETYAGDIESFEWPTFPDIFDASLAKIGYYDWPTAPETA